MARRGREDDEDTEDSQASSDTEGELNFNFDDDKANGYKLADI